MLPSVVLALALTQFDQRFALTWNVPCAPMPEVAALLGTAEGEAVVTVRPDEAHWHLEVAFVSPARGVRQLDAPTCEDAARAALLFLKLGATAQPPRSPVVMKPPEPEPPPPLPVASPPVPLEVRIAVGAGANVGALPAVSPRLEVAAGLSAGPIAGFLGVRTGVPGTFAGGPGQARFLVHPVLGAQLSGCFLARVGRARLGPCVAAAVEWWRVAGLGVDLPRGGSEVWVAAGADARLAVPLTRGLFAFAVAGVRFSLRRPQIVFAELGEAYTVPVFSGEGALGLGWQW